MSPEMKLEVCRINVNGAWLLWVYIMDGFYFSGLPRWYSGKEPTCNAGDSRDTSLISGSGKSPWGGHGNPLQYSCLENSMDKRAWGGLQSQGLQRVKHNWAQCHVLFCIFLCIIIDIIGKYIFSIKIKYETWNTKIFSRAHRLVILELGRTL